MLSEKLRIGVLTTFPPGTGSLNEYGFHFVSALREKFDDVAEVILYVDELPNNATYPSFEDEAITTQIVPCWSFDALNNPLRILKAVRNTDPDIVLFNLQWATFGGRKVPASLGLVTPALVRAFGIPTVVLLHNIMETVDLKSAGYAGNPLMEAIVRGFGNVATRILLRSNLVALTIPKYVEILEAKYKADNVVLAPHGSFDDNVQHPVFELPDGPMQIMTFGKFGTYKTVEALIEAFEILQNRGRQPLELVIAGSDSPNAKGYLAGVAERYQHVEEIRYTGYVAEEDVPIIFGEAAAVVFPYTSTTGSSGVLHQAGDYGKAVILPNIGDFAEVITEEGYTGEFFEPENPQSMAEAIAKVIDNPDRRREIGQQNFLASHGIPISEIVDWYLLHMQTLLIDSPRASRRQRRLRREGATA